MDKKQNRATIAAKPIAIEKQKYIKLAKEIQKIVAQEKTAQHAH